MLVAGLVGPAAGEPAPVVPATVVRTVEGLPAARAGAAVSKQVATPIPFSVIGFEVPRGANLAFRTSLDGESWGPWTEAEVSPEEGPDPGSAEARAANPRVTLPVWVGAARHVQTRLEGRRGAASPERAAVHLIDSSGLGRSWSTRVADRLRAAWRGTPPSAEATAGRPDIVTRKEWGANESLRRGGPSYAPRIKAGFVHHTASTNNYSRAEAPAVVRGIYSYHVQSNGWSDIGYNFLVDRFGTIYEGRYGGMTKPVIGAHAGGFNTETFGVSLLGTFNSATPPAEMKSGLRRLLAWKYDNHHVSVLGETSYTSYGSTRYSAGTTVSINRLAGHREASLTVCPGDRVYAQLPTLRTEIAQLQGPVILYPRASPTTVQIVDGATVSGPVEFRAQLRPAGSWTVKILNAAGTTVHTKTGSGEYLKYDWYPAGTTPGSYRYVISSTGRRPGGGGLTLEPPTISASASRPTTTVQPGGAVAPVTFSGTLYSGANWTLRIFNAAGEVHRATGTGSSFSTAWRGPLNAPPGMYRWEVSTDDAVPVGGSLRIFADYVDRLARPSGAAAAAAAISTRTFAAGTAKHAVLTPAGRAGFATAAGPLAGTAGPVLFSNRTSAPAETIAELDRVLPDGGTVFVLGDTSVIAATALDGVAATRQGKWKIARISGADAIAVAARAARVVLNRSGATGVVLAGNTTSTSWRQSVGAGGYAARSGQPVLLTTASRLSAPAADVLSSPSITNVTIVGDTDAVAAGIGQQLRATKTVRRVAGASARATAVAVSRVLFGRTTAAAGDRYLFANITRDDGWVRALAAVPLSARTRAPVLVSYTTTVPEATATYLDGLGYSEARLGRGIVLGDGEHVNEAVEATLAQRLQ